MKKVLYGILPYLRLRRLLRGLHLYRWAKRRVGSNVGFSGEFLRDQRQHVSSAVGVALAATGGGDGSNTGPQQPRPPVPSNKVCIPKIIGSLHLQLEV